MLRTSGAFKYEVERRDERLLIWFVWRLPKRLVYWCAIRVGAHATTGKYDSKTTPELLFVDALHRWPR